MAYSQGKSILLALGVYCPSRQARLYSVPQIVTATEIGWGNRVFEISRRLIAQKSKMLVGKIIHNVGGLEGGPGVQ